MCCQHTVFIHENFENHWKGRHNFPQRHITTDWHARVKDFFQNSYNWKTFLHFGPFKGVRLFKWLQSHPRMQDQPTAGFRFCSAEHLTLSTSERWDVKRLLQMGANDCLLSRFLHQNTPISSSFNAFPSFCNSTKHTPQLENRMDIKSRRDGVWPQRSVSGGRDNTVLGVWNFGRNSSALDWWYLDRHAGISLLLELP